MLAGNKKKLFAIACLCVLPMQPAYAAACSGGLFDAGSCPRPVWELILIFSPILVPLLILAFSLSMLASYVIFKFVWGSELDRHVVTRCVWTWVPVGMLAWYAVIRSTGRLFPYDYLTGWSYFLFIHIVQIILGFLWFCAVAFSCRNLKFKVILYDGLMVVIAWFLAYWVRFNLDTIPQYYLDQAIVLLPLVVLIHIGMFLGFSVHRGAWLFTSTLDVFAIIKPVFFGTALIAVAIFLAAWLEAVPRSVFLLHSGLVIGLLVTNRLLYRAHLTFPDKLIQ